ncbi:MAG TPA: DNA polymerase I [bacterium]|jgi:DNA polymerase-1
MSDRLFLIDGSAQMYRAHFAFIRNPLRTSRGEITSAIYGFLTSLFNLIENEKPSHMAIVFDTPAPTFRHKTLPTYKATRQKMPDELVSQLGRLYQVLESTGIRIISRPGWEADDVIGTMATDAEQEGFEVVMVTGDKDYQQLVTEKVRMWNAKPDGVVLMGPEEVQQHFGVPPEKVVDVLALTGDTSDNVPGAEGIGPKTAVKLITEYGSLDKVLDAAPSMKPSKMREALIRDREKVLLARELVTIDRKAPVEFKPEELTLGMIWNPELERLLIDLELFKLVERLRTVFGGTSAKHADTGRSVRKFRTVSTTAELEELAAQWQKEKPLLSFDVETTGTDPMRAELVGASFSTVEGEAVYISMDHLDGPAKPGRRFLRFGHEVPAGVATYLSIVAEVLENSNVPKTGQNLKYDVLVYKTYGIEVEGVAFDTILAAYLLNPGDRTLSLDSLARDYLKLPKIATQELLGRRGKDQITMREVDVERVSEYACEDADYALRLSHVLEPLLENQGRILCDIELPLMPVLCDMEFTGVKLDVDLLHTMSKELERDLSRIEEDCFRLAGEVFNLNSPKKLAMILFEKLKLPVQRMLKSGPSTDIDTLTVLAPMHELPKRLMDYRMLSKLKNTYVDTLPGLVHPDTGRVHTTFSQTVAATGRLSSVNPNLQNIPIRTEVARGIRESFVAGTKGWKMVSADYSQIELRIMAHLSGDERMLEAFERGGDIHTETAALIFQVPVGMVDVNMRRAAKTVNFGIIYGQTDFGLAQELGLPRHEARVFRENYFALYPGVTEFMRRTIEECRKRGYVETILGRQRKIPDIEAPDRQVRQFAERTAINTPVQGSAADMIKLAMIAIHRRLNAEKFAAKMLLQVHDELVFEAPDDEIERLAEMVRHEMQTALPLRVPVMVEIGSGSSWLGAHA